MKLEIVEHCFGQYVRVNGVDVCDMDNVYPKEELFEKRMLLIKELTDSNLFVHPSIWIDIANSLSGLDSFEYNDEESSSDVCEQCGNWNSTNVYDKKEVVKQKQAIIDMMKADEELGLYDESNETLEELAERLHPDNGFEDDLYCDEGKIFRESWLAGAKWQQKRSYSEEEVVDIAKQAFVLGANFGLIGTFNEWFETVKKK